ncbi:MAG: gamma-glutamyltransferase [Verrucomicrobiota bacterium]|nr:gamma-glutamyltransferase [Verrucomicrobiota bacterium]
MCADRITGQAFATRSEVFATHGMACTSHPLATQVALDVLKKGGTAVDAAIAANATLGLMEPVSNGIGGDLFAIIWDPKTQKLHAYNGSGRSPKALTLEEFKRLGIKSIPSKGVLPVSVPGCVDGWFALHERFGKLPMQEVLAPAINYADEGFPVTELIAFYWERSIRSLGDQPGFLDTYTVDGKRAPKKGELFKNPKLAATLRQIATGGRAAYYEGNIARTMDGFMKRVGGYLRYEDLAAHHGNWVDPVSTNYRGYDVWEIPPNGQGIAALQMLNILEGYDIKSMGWNSADYVHLFTEAKKLAFEDRARYYADMEFSKVPVAQLISKPYAAERRKLIQMDRAARRYEPGEVLEKLGEGDTIYMTVADSSGCMVSLIQSNYRGNGSGLCPDGLGFCLQNRGEMFTFEEGHPNQYAPGKRPFHTIIPGFITKDGQPYISFGVMGGAMQPQGHVQIVINLVDFGLNLQEAGDCPRMQHYGSSEPTGEKMTNGGELALETGFAWEVISELQRRGHKVISDLGGFGGYQAIMRNNETGVYAGASESRKDGCAMGY